jgi:TRAP-type C4-dicarboxylate transport system permease small subunit
MKNNKVVTFLNNIEKYMIAALFMLMTVIMVFQVTTRYGFGFTVAWLEQFARLIFVWISFVGISYAATRSQHIRVSAMATFIKGKGGKVFLLIGDLICVLISLYLAYKIGGLTITVYTKHQYFSAMPFMPIWVMYISGVLGMLGLAIRTLQYGVIPDIKAIRGIEAEEPAKQEFSQF